MIKVHATSTLFWPRPPDMKLTMLQRQMSVIHDIMASRDNLTSSKTRIMVGSGLVPDTLELL